MKENDDCNIHKRFRVHSTDIFGLEAKTNITRSEVPTIPSTPKFDSLPYPYPRVGW